MTGPIPVACELGSEEQRARVTEIRRLVTSRARRIEPLPDGMVLHFDGGSEWIDRLVALVKAERTCCRFLRFRLDVEPDEAAITLWVTGPEGTAEFLRTWTAG